MESDVGQTGKPEPSPISTRALLAKLPPHVTVRDLKNERDRGFLPPLEDGRWTHEGVRRAKKLYRLRKLGADGVTLKLLLFLEDGWGWTGIQNACVKGLERIIAVNLNGVAKYRTAKGHLDFYVEEISEHQHKALLRKAPDTTLTRTSDETTAYVVGTLTQGTPLEGGSARGIAVPLAKAAWPGISESDAALYAAMFEVLTAMLDLPNIAQRLKATTAEQAAALHRRPMELARDLRMMMRNMAGTDAKGHSNILTCFGHAKDTGDVDFSIGDVWLSMELALAGVVGMSIAVDLALKSLYESMTPMLPMLLQMMPQPAQDVHEVPAT